MRSDAWLTRFRRGRDAERGEMRSKRDGNAGLRVLAGFSKGDHPLHVGTVRTPRAAFRLLIDDEVVLHRSSLTLVAERGIGTVSASASNALRDRLNFFGTH
jgi:hypothetical protein